MEPATATRSRRSGWLAGLVPLGVLGLAIGLFVALDAPGLDRRGVPEESLAVERTVLRAGEIELRVRNDGADPVAVKQVLVNDAFATFDGPREQIGRLGGARFEVSYPWIEGQNYEIALVTATGATIDHAVEAATETPDADLGFYGLMALIGLYVGVIPIAIGMLWLPWVRTIDRRLFRLAMSFTIGLLAFLGIDAALEGLELAGAGAEAFGGAALVFLGAIVSYLLLAAVDAFMRGRRDEAREGGASGMRLALLVAIGIGLHNLGEGLAIGSAYAIGALALGASLVVGFALHNTTEGLAIVAPAAQDGSPRLSRLAGLGLVAGAPAILGAWIGASAFHPSLAALLFGLGVGAIAQVIVQLTPLVRERGRPLLEPLTAGGILAGVAVMYVTSLAISL
jgi:zinc transporter ZupT